MNQYMMLASKFETLEIQFEKIKEAVNFNKPKGEVESMKDRFDVHKKMMK